MGMFFGNINPSAFLVGDKIVTKILLNTNLIWEKNGGGEVDDLPYLRFTAEEAGSTVKMIKNSTSAPTVYLETSPTGEEGSWTEFFVHTSSTSTDGTIITLTNVGDKVYFRAKQDNKNFSNGFSYNCFAMTGKIAASGNLNTLLKADGSVFDLTGRDFCFSYMFFNCTSLTQASELELPATVLTENCYYYMFRNCSSLTQAPVLPAEFLAERCYAQMFSNCTSLTQAPKVLPATVLTENCYYYMFNNCTSLTKAPELPATVLTENCYNSMFQYCSSLTKAPELKATTLANNCYFYIFSLCRNMPSFTVDMTACTSVPSLPSATLFSSSNKPYTVLVPASLYDEWIQATNWSTIVSNIQAV